MTLKLNSHQSTRWSQVYLSNLIFKFSRKNLISFSVFCFQRWFVSVCVRTRVFCGYFCRRKLYHTLNTRKDVLQCGSAYESADISSDTEFSHKLDKDIGCLSVALMSRILKSSQMLLLLVAGPTMMAKGILGKKSSATSLKYKDTEHFLRYCIMTIEQLHTTGPTLKLYLYFMQIIQLTLIHHLISIYMPGLDLNLYARAGS
mgnify:CR=1 FL=1